MLRFLWRALGALLVLLLVALVVLRLLAALRETGGLLNDEPPGRVLDTAEGRIHLMEAGPEDGPPVLLIHGSVGWSGLWVDTMEALAAGGYRAIAMDLPPMGYSDRTADQFYLRTDQARRILATADALDVQPLLVAHSFGAGAATEAVLTGPDAISGYVMVDAALGLDATAPAWPISAAIDLPLFSEALVSATITNPAATKRLLKLFLHRKEAASDAYVAIIQQPLDRIGTTAALARWLPTLLTPQPDALSADRARLARLVMPVAILWGAEDTTTPLSQAEDLVALLPDAQLTVLNGVGHIPQIEDPPAFHAALLAALENLRTGH